MRQQRIKELLSNTNLFTDAELRKKKFQPNTNEFYT